MLAPAAARRDAGRPCIDRGVPLTHRSVTRLPGRRSPEFIRWVRYRHGERRGFTPVNLCFCAVRSSYADPDHMLTKVESSRIAVTDCSSDHILVVDDDPAVRHLADAVGVFSPSLNPRARLHVYPFHPP